MFAETWDCRVDSNVDTTWNINTEWKPDIVSNKRKLIRWIQKAYEDLMEDVGIRNLRSGKQLQDLLFFVEKFEGHNTGVGHINSRELQENNAQTNQQEQPKQQDVIYDNGTAQ